MSNYVNKNTHSNEFKISTTIVEVERNTLHNHSQFKSLIRKVFNFLYLNSRNSKLVDVTFNLNGKVVLN